MTMVFRIVCVVAAIAWGRSNHEVHAQSDPPPAGGIRITPENVSGQDPYWTATVVTGRPNYWDITIHRPQVYRINWDVGIDANRPAIRTLAITQPPIDLCAVKDVFRMVPIRMA